MSSVLCQELQSCIEPYSHVLWHKLLPCPQTLNLSQENQQEAENNGGCNDSELRSNNNEGWSIIQTLTNLSNNAKQGSDQTEMVYVHPLVKRSASAPSTKGLELCTESLGSETGSDSSDDLISSLSWETEKMQLPNEEFSSVSMEKKSGNRLNNQEFPKKFNSNRSFPPPLTSFSGLNGGVQVRPHRQGGRLVIEALKISSCPTNFEANRANGRLQLSVVNDCLLDFHKSEMISEKEEEEVQHNEEESEEVLENESFSELNEQEEDEEEVDEENESCCGEDMDGNVGNVGGEIGIGEVPRSSRCKEGGRGCKGCQIGAHFGLPFLERFPKDSI